MADKKIKIDKALFNRVKEYAELSGYSSVEELTVHLLEQELSKVDGDDESKELIEKRLRGLGYIS